MKKPTLQGLNKEVEFIQEKLSGIMEMMTKLHADMPKSKYPQPPVAPSPVPLPGMPQVHNPFMRNNIFSTPFKRDSIFSAQPYPVMGAKPYTGELDGALNIEIKAHSDETLKLCFRLAKSGDFPLKVSSALARIYTDNKVDLSIYLYGLVDLNGFSKVLVFDYIAFPSDKLFMNATGAPYTLFSSLTKLLESRGDNNTISITDKNVSEIRFFRDSDDSVDFYSHGNFQNIRVRLENFPSGGPSFGYCM